jgi:hypothetical protein
VILSPSTTTKSDILNAAYGEMGLSGYAFDMSSDEVGDGLRKLDMLMAAAPFGNVPLGYNFPTTVSDLKDPTGFSDSFAQTIAIALARRIAPSKGKQLSGETHKDYQAGLNALLAAFACIPASRMRSNTPVGSGNKWRSTWRPYVVNGCACPPLDGTLLTDDGALLTDGGALVVDG